MYKNLDKTVGELNGLENLSIYLYNELYRVQKETSCDFPDKAGDELKKAILLSIKLNILIADVHMWTMLEAKKAKEKKTNVLKRK